ncbi:MAG: CYTH domain-containing protein [Myxococcota bacterium]|nr:CYTH domain-containing protein [Myxococcota bacterium]
MGTEIERKFLIASDDWRRAGEGERFQQGYLSVEPERTVRVRLAGERAQLTIKGRTVGATRPEFEYDIPVEDARQLLSLCIPPLIEKTRYRLSSGGHLWEIDEFHGVNAGLVVAEVELESEDEEVVLPDWVGAEVTEQPAYYNANLTQRPYSTWPRD